MTYKIHSIPIPDASIENYSNEDNGVLLIIMNPNGDPTTFVLDKYKAVIKYTAKTGIVLYNYQVNIRYASKIW